MTETSRDPSLLSRGSSGKVDDRAPTGLQPLLHDLVSVVRAPSLVLSGPDGQLRPGGVQGWFRSDLRLLSALTVHVGGREPDSLHAEQRGASGAAFTAVARHLGDPGGDPSVLLDRTREVSDERLTETLTVTSTAQAEVDLELTVTAASDLTPIATVRSGQPATPVEPTPAADGLAWTDGGDAASTTVSLACDPAPDTVDHATGTLTWHRRLATRQSLTVELTAGVDGQDPEFTGPRRPQWAQPEIVAGDNRLGAVVSHGLGDLSGLLLCDSSSPGGDHFLAAGTPWFLTLFGRDSLWAARMLLPLGTDLALSTLRALARRQGTRDDAGTEEQPGKILHEVRGAPFSVGAKTLPPLYYGSVDATALFVTLLAESWRWGADTEQVAALLPNAEACLAWLDAQAGGEFIRYVDATGKGLSNQGWKDSDDGIQWADGRLAEAPIALSEVQAYAFQAATLGADLLEAFGRPGAGHWRDWADGLATRFRRSFWVQDHRGRYPAVALDANGRAVDSVASNMGHLLGTGLLDDDEAAAVAERLGSDDMDSGFGLRTLTRDSPRYSRLSYHGGSVWPHDTAIAVHGLCREGHRRQAASLLRGLVAASPAFDFRLPELYSGDDARVRAPVPYPTACRPQAWAAAAPLWALVAALGVEADLPHGVVSVPEQVEASFAPLRVNGLVVGGQSMDVSVAEDGRVTATVHGTGLEVRTRR
ncbi:MAG: amylo-alpha-1,6-glucosidase [Nocardioidaceae bacterium]